MLGITTARSNPCEYFTNNALTFKCFWNPYVYKYTRCNAIFFILNYEGIIEKIPYERRAYESVDDGSIFQIKSRKEEKK